MYKSIDTVAKNSVVINGTLLGMEIREGKTSALKGSKPYRAANATIRVNQHFGGRDEISEIPVSFIAMKHKKDGNDNPVYETLGKYGIEYKTAQKDGIENATQVNINGRRGNGALAENMFCDSRNPETVISSWNINASFLNEARGNSPASSADCATFDIEIFILSMDREVSPAGEETGRLKMRGGVVKFGRKIDCLDFYVEDPTAVDYIERNYSVNDTVNVVGRIRMTSETVTHDVQNSWGEAIPQTTTRKKRELIITHGSDEPYAEDMAYDPEDIRVLMTDRNALKETKKMEARNKAATSKTSTSASKAPASGYDWEE